MSIAGYISGAEVLLVGVEDHGDETRLYIGHRADCRYVAISHEHAEDCERARRAWAGNTGHLTIARPPDDSVQVDQEQIDANRAAHAASLSDASTGA